MILNTGQDHRVQQLVARANSAWLVLEMHAPFLPNDMLPSNHLGCVRISTIFPSRQHVAPDLDDVYFHSGLTSGYEQGSETFKSSMHWQVLNYEDWPLPTPKSGHS